MGWLLDTNIISELRRLKPAPKVVAFIGAQLLARLFVSVVTLAEIRFGIELITDAGRRAELHDWLTHKVRPMFATCTIDLSCFSHFDHPCKRDNAVFYPLPRCIVECDRR